MCIRCASRKSTTFTVKNPDEIFKISEAEFVIKVNDEVPENLYYKLDVVNEDFVAEVKKQIVVDTDVFNNNQINIITNIAKSIPVDCLVYVKEHPTQIAFAWRPISYYKANKKVDLGFVGSCMVHKGDIKIVGRSERYYLFAICAVSISLGRFGRFSVTHLPNVRAESKLR